MKKERWGPWLALATLLGVRVAVCLWIRAALNGATFWSPSEIIRLEHAMAWAEAPSLSPLSASYWLPLPFAAHGLALRALGDALSAAFWVDLAASTACLVFIFAIGRRLSGSTTAGLAAATLAGVQSTGITLACGASADPLFQMFAVGGLFFWLRAQDKDSAVDFWLSATLLGASASARYEGWALCAFFAAVTFKKRRAAAAAALAVPGFWLLYNWLALGSPLAFLRQTLDIGLIYDSRLHGAFWRLGQFFLYLLGEGSAPCLALAVVGWGASRDRRVGRYAVLASAPPALILAACLAGDDAFVDRHLWAAQALLAPLAGIGLAACARAWRRPALAAGLAAAIVASQARELQNDVSAHAAWDRAPFIASCLRVRRWRGQGRLGNADAALLELPVGPQPHIPELYRLWKIVQDDYHALFDRRYRPAWDGARRFLTAEPDNSSMLDSDPALLAAWLAQEHVRLIVVERAGAPAGWRQIGAEGEFRFLIRRDDSLSFP